MLAKYEQVNNTANTHFDGRLEAGVETVPQITIDKTAYVIQKHQHQSYTPFTLSNPVFYIPQLAGTAQRWFAADAVAESGGVSEHQLLLFIQRKPGAPWLLAAAPVSVSGRPLPVALSAGTATTAAAHDRELAITPSQLPARHAELISSLSASAAFARGKWTDTLIRGVKSFKRAYRNAGWSYRDHWFAAGYPVYALRTKDGGAVVWYFLKDRQAAVRSGAARPLGGGAVIRALTGKSQVAHRFTIDSVSEFVAIIPPKGKGKVAIEAGSTGNVAATSR